MLPSDYTDKDTLRVYPVDVPNTTMNTDPHIVGDVAAVMIANTDPSQGLVSLKDLAERRCQAVVRAHELEPDCARVVSSRGGKLAWLVAQPASATGAVQTTRALSSWMGAVASLA